MSRFSKVLKVAKLGLQFACFAHAFNQYVAEVTWVCFIFTSKKSFTYNPLKSALDLPCYHTLIRQA